MILHAHKHVNILRRYHIITETVLYLEAIPTVYAIYTERSDTCVDSLVFCAYFQSSKIGVIEISIPVWL